MEIYNLKQDIRVICVEAKSFPGGIKAAFEQLNTAVPDMAGRTLFGISKPQNGIIRYRAAVAENFTGEGTALGLPSFIITQGNYLGETLLQWQQNEMMITGIFNRLVADKRLDGSAHCIEWYKNDTELLCLVLMNTDKVPATVKQLAITH